MVEAGSNMTKTVLLIDYDPNSIGRIRRILGPAGVRIELSLDGRSGLEEIRRLRPDVTIVQDLLPVVSGLDVCSEIKQSEDCADLRIVILSGPRQHLTLMKTDCDAYIEKPYQDSELLEVVTELLKRPDTDARPVVESGPTSRHAELPVVVGPSGGSVLPVELTEADLDTRLDELLVFAPRVAVSG
jgi:DNA-binding response OmpR family regulator